MLSISNYVAIPDTEIDLQAIRAQGSGGQNVNKVSTAIHLRFDIANSTLPIFYKEALLKLNDNRITKEGVIVIKAQASRSQEQNKEAALSRLQSLVKSVAIRQKRRQPTTPTKGSQLKRVDSKTKRGQLKNLRSKIDYIDK